MSRFKTYSTIFALSLGLGACAGDVTEDPDTVTEEEEEETPEEVDVAAPSVVSISPEAGAIGQYEDTVVTIVFSEPMAPETVAPSLQTSSLGDVELNWNAAGDTLTITPTALLPYAPGIGLDPSSVTAEQFNVSLNAEPSDLAGNALVSGVQTNFATLRKMEVTFEPDHTMTRTMMPGGLILTEEQDLAVGDTINDESLRSLISFNLENLPEDTVEVGEATLATRQLPGLGQGTPYSDLGASIVIDHVLVDSLETELDVNAAYNASQVALGSLGSFCIEDQIIIQHDVSAAVSDDVANRAERDDFSQYLLYYPLATDFGVENQGGDYDYSAISRELIELQVSYLAP